MGDCEILSEENKKRKNLILRNLQVIIVFLLFLNK